MAPPKEKKIYIYRKTYYIIIMYYICICDTRFLILYRDITFLELEGWLSEGPEVGGSSCLWGAGVESGKLGQLVSIMAQGEQFDSKTFTSLARIKIRANKEKSSTRQWPMGPSPVYLPSSSLFSTLPSSLVPNLHFRIRKEDRTAGR